MGDGNTGDKSALGEGVFRALLENSEDLTILADSEGQVIYISPQCEVVLGHPPERFIGGTFPDIIHPEDQARCLETWRRVLETGSGLKDFEYRVLDAEGGTRWVSHSVKPVALEGLRHGVHNIIRDITTRKEEQEEFLASKRFIETLLETSPDVIYLYDIVEKRNVYTNDRISTHLGYTADEIRGFGDELIMKLMHPEDFEVYVSEILPKYQSLIDDEPIEHQYRMRHSDGGWYWLESREIVFSRCEDGSPRQIFGLMSDFNRKHEIERAQAELRLSEQRYRSLFAHMGSAFALHEIITDDAGAPIDYRFLEINHEFERMTGLLRAAVVGKTVREVLPGTEDDPADWIGKYGGVALNGDVLQFTQLSEALGKWYAVVAYSPAARQFATIFTDITEQKQLERRLAEAEKLKAIGQLAGGIAHDFNNQLAGIVGYADLIHGTAPPGSEVAEFSECILLATRRAADLTKQLLAFARKGKYLSIPVDVNALVRETVGVLKHTINKQIRVTPDLDDAPAVVIGDPSLLQNAIMNLALNARDAMPHGGELRLSTRPVWVSGGDGEGLDKPGLEPGGYVELRVADTGEGMDEGTRARMFEPFFTTKDLKGTGMGLAAVYGTVKSHKGLIEVESAPGEGTTVCIYLRAEGLLLDAPSTEPPALKRGDARVLVVDDEVVVLNACCAMLRKLGYAVVGCSSSAEAAALYAEEWRRFDLVIIDMVMPELDGQALYRAMREVNPDVVAVLSSGYSLEGWAQGMHDQGIAAMVQKPFRLSDLSRKVAEALALKARGGA